MKNDKYEKEKSLLSEMLAESLCEDYDEIIRTSGMTADCSEEQKQRIRDTVYGKKPARINWSNAWKIAVALLGVLIALTGCAFGVWLGNKVAGFIEYVYEEYIYLDTENEDRAIIEDVYELTYVPEGFELLEKTITPNMIFYKWKNTTGNKLKFTQTPTYVQFYIDIENEFTLLLEYSNTTIYYRTTEYSHFYIWCNDKNTFKMICTIPLDNTEIMKILDGMIITE